MDLNKSVVAYKSVRKDFEAFLRVGEALEEISSLQNYKVEAEVAAKKAKDALAEVNGLLLVRRSELRETYERVLFAKETADEVVEKAKDESEELVSEANKEAGRIVSDARSWVSATKQDAVDEVESKKDEIKKLETKEANVSNQIEKLKAEFIKLKRRFS